MITELFVSEANFSEIKNSIDATDLFGLKAKVRGKSYGWNVNLDANISTFNSEVTIKGNLDPIESDTFRIRSNDIILGYSTTSNPSSNFTGNITSGSALVTNIDNTVDLIAHKPIELVSASGNLTIDSSAKIVSVASSTLIMSHAVTGTGSGTATFRLGGAGTEIAENGGIIIRGDTDKTILYKTSGINATNGVFHLSHGIQLNTGQLHIVDDTDGNITIGSTTVITKDKVHDKVWTNLIDNSNDNSGYIPTAIAVTRRTRLMSSEQYFLTSSI